jgi:hypothetical protein
MTEVFHGFPQFLQANAGVVPSVSPCLVPSTAFPLHNSSVMLPFDAL